MAGAVSKLDDTLEMNAEIVLAGLARLRADGPAAVADFLDPDVEMLGPEPSRWDCHGREEVVRFLDHFEPGGTRLEVTEATDFGDQVLLGTTRRHPDGWVQDSFSVVSFRDGRVVQLRGFPTRARALAAVGPA
jgi:ketosteroid isomerase-like protein